MAKQRKALIALTALTFVVASCGNAQTTTDTTTEPAEPAPPAPTQQPTAEVVIETEPVTAAAKPDIEALRKLPKVALPTKVGDCVELTAIKKFPRLQFNKPDDPEFDPSWETLEKYLSWNDSIAIGVAFNAEHQPFTDSDPSPFSPYLDTGPAFLEGPDFASGNKVKVCLEVIPDCAAENKGNPNYSTTDQRGRIYQFTDLKTSASREAADSWHLCGGA